MKEKTSTSRTFEFESYMEHANFVGFIRKEGYIISPKYGPESKCYNLRKSHADTEGSIFSFRDELELRVIVGSELEELTDKFIFIENMGEED